MRAAMGLVLLGCGASTQENAATAGAYEAEQLACIDRAQTRGEADACRCAVRARYGRPCDGGAP